MFSFLKYPEIATSHHGFGVKQFEKISIATRRILGLEKPSIPAYRPLIPLVPWLSVCLPVCLCACLSVLSFYLSRFLACRLAHLAIRPPVCSLPVRLSVLSYHVTRLSAVSLFTSVFPCPPVCLSVYLSASSSVYLSVRPSVRRPSNAPSLAVT